MKSRITVVPTVADARAAGILRNLQNLFPGTKLTDVKTASTYTIDAVLSRDQVLRAAERLTNPVIETSSIETVPTSEEYSYAIEIGFLPGVTDNVGHTAKQTIEDATSRAFVEGEAVYTSLFVFLIGDISREDAEAFAAELHNPLIERAVVYKAGEQFDIVVPKVALGQSKEPITVDLDVSDDELEKIGKQGIADESGRRGPLALSIEELKAIRNYFKKEKRQPTDIELEALAQTWSEHCKHTIFGDPLDEIREGIYRKYIKGATQKIRKGRKGKKGDKRDFCVSVFKDNSGAIAFDKDYLITHKVETHNSPSGLDPFGGSVTAIGGVNRDSIGFGLGAKPIANVYGFCVADPQDARQLFRDVEKQQPLLSARRILEGVVKGINAGGNQSGIPTPLGFVAIDPSFRGKPLVFGGTVGLIPRTINRRKSFEKQAKPGDYIVMIGGRVGLDGVHGATFSSESLSANSPATAVQIGDPITQKKFSDAIIREARDKGLYNSITDNGAGGLSSSVGEMSRESGGCIVDLDAVPLKYPGLSPWQIWISESQERMTLAVPKTKWGAFKKICTRHDVEATVIGTFTKSGRVIVRHDGKDVMNMSLDFLHDGRPVKKQRSKKPKKHAASDDKKARSEVFLKRAFLDVLARPSVGSISFISRQYDHEVLAQSVTKPLQGKGGVNADFGVMRPLPESDRGVVLSHGYTPWYSEIDTYAMAAAAIDTAVRNAICAGASREYLAILDNFCWSSSENPERLYELKRAAKACYDVAVAYGTPFISGKDSMHNDFKGFTEKGERTHIAALPTLLVSAIGVVPDISKAITIDFKMPGDVIYLLGETNDELGASEYLTMLGATGKNVPQVNVKKNAKVYDAVTKAIAGGLLASAIGLSRGGLAVALAKSSIAGQRGVAVDVSKVPGNAKLADSVLCSESQGRILVSVRPDAAAAFEKICKGVAIAKIGTVSDGRAFSMRSKGEDIQLALEDVTAAYRSFFKEW
ncbi:phosphoribosylformylglycinamidine synthase [Candidatus Parcubacteria bacterium]|nr:MAG: phosphoribosylformylglycinamidine synthase [Candidatus Parcubacteria bacterium]